MMNPNQIFAIVVLTVVATVPIVAPNSDEHYCDPKPNQRVILGVLAQEYNSTHQQIPASYVKYAESGGARVVPIFVGQPKQYYQQLVTKINGLLMPGGELDLVDSQYGQAAELLLELAIELNSPSRSVHFPVWGTCLSFQKIITHFVGNCSWLSKCHVSNVALNLDIEPWVLDNLNSTKMFQCLYSDSIIQILLQRRISPNYHNYCLSKDKFDQLLLGQQFTLISTNTYAGVKFVSTIEHKHYPIYGSAWHPEMNQFEFVLNHHTGNITHDHNAVLVGQYFANFLVQEAAKNEHRFADKQEEIDSLIYNYNQYRVYTGLTPKEFYEEMFIFPNDIVYSAK